MGAPRAHETPAGDTAWFEGNKAGPCPAADPADALRLDPAIKPVSISKANAEEQRAIDLCISYGFTVEDVAGMGRVPRAKRLQARAARSAEPDLTNDQPVWVVDYRGMLRLPRGGGVARDPICFLTELEPGPILLLPVARSTRRRKSST